MSSLMYIGLCKCIEEVWHPGFLALTDFETETATHSKCLFVVILFVGKKTKKKGKTLTLTDFLAEDSGGSSSVVPSYSNKSTSWADETDDLDGDGEHRMHSHFHQFDDNSCLKYHNIH